MAFSMLLKVLQFFFMERVNTELGGGGLDDPILFGALNLSIY